MRKLVPFLSHLELNIFLGLPRRFKSGQRGILLKINTRWFLNQIVINHHVQFISHDGTGHRRQVATLTDLVEGTQSFHTLRDLVFWATPKDVADIPQVGG